MSMPPVVTYTMEITPSPVTVPMGQTQQFVATKVGSDGSHTNPPVFWTTNAGTITDEGLFTPRTDMIGSQFYDDTGTLNILEVTATENDSA
jgi:hypothetical protein